MQVAVVVATDLVVVPMEALVAVDQVALVQARADKQVQLIPVEAVAVVMATNHRN